MIAGVDENVHRHVEICEIDDNKSFSIILKQEYYKLFMSEAIVFLVLFLSSVNACHGDTLKFLSAQESDTVVSSSSDQSESCLHFPLPIRKQDLALSTLSDSCKLRNLSVLGT